MNNPLLENPILQGEYEKVQQIYDTGYELYDTAEHITHGTVSVGNLLRVLSDILIHKDEAAPLKADTTDSRLIMYLEEMEEQLNECGETLTACEDRLREIRTGLVSLTYKKSFPQKESDGTKQTVLEVGA